MQPLAGNLSTALAQQQQDANQSKHPVADDAPEKASKKKSSRKHSSRRSSKSSASKSTTSSSKSSKVAGPSGDQAGLATDTRHPSPPGPGGDWSSLPVLDPANVLAPPSTLVANAALQTSSGVVPSHMAPPPCPPPHRRKSSATSTVSRAPPDDEATPTVSQAGVPDTDPTIITSQPSSSGQPVFFFDELDNSSFNVMANNDSGLLTTTTNNTPLPCTSSTNTVLNMNLPVFSGPAPTVVNQPLVPSQETMNLRAVPGPNGVWQLIQEPVSMPASGQQFLLPPVPNNTVTSQPQSCSPFSWFQQQQAAILQQIQLNQLSQQQPPLLPPVTPQQTPQSRPVTQTPLVSPSDLATPPAPPHNLPVNHGNRLPPGSGSAPVATPTTPALPPGSALQPPAANRVHSTPAADPPSNGAGSTGFNMSPIVNNSSASVSHSSHRDTSTVFNPFGNIFDPTPDGNASLVNRHLFVDNASVPGSNGSRSVSHSGSSIQPDDSVSNVGPTQPPEPVPEPPNPLAKYDGLEDSTHHGFAEVLPEDSTSSIPPAHRTNRAWYHMRGYSLKSDKWPKATQINNNYAGAEAPAFCAPTLPSRLPAPTSRSWSEAEARFKTLFQSYGAPAHLVAKLFGEAETSATKPLKALLLDPNFSDPAARAIVRSVLNFLEGSASVTMGLALRSLAASFNDLNVRRHKAFLRTQAQSFQLALSHVRPGFDSFFASNVTDIITDTQYANTVKVTNTAATGQQAQSEGYNRFRNTRDDRRRDFYQRSQSYRQSQQDNNRGFNRSTPKKYDNKYQSNYRKPQYNNNKNQSNSNKGNNSTPKKRGGGKGGNKNYKHRK